MFNVSILLMDNAFKPATPLTNVVISEMLRDSLSHPVTFYILHFTFLHTLEADSETISHF